MTAHTAADFERDADLIDTYLPTDTPEAVRQRVVDALRIAARVMTPGVIENALYDGVVMHSTILIKAGVGIRAALTGGENGS